jgi:hypothetical protein
MEQAAQWKDGAMPESVVTSKVARARLAIGLLQGLLLYFLYRAARDFSWPATEAYLFAPLLLVGLIVPVILVSSLGHLGRKQTWSWVLAAAVVIGALGVYDAWRGGAGNFSWFYADPAKRTHFPTFLLLTFAVAGFYIAHALVLAGAADKRRIAAYPTYFETAWKLLIQIKFSALFVGALWLALELGGALFSLVGLRFFMDLLQESWFAIPVTAFAFSCAIHITDVRPAIVRGIRALLLVLMSWLLPVTTLIMIGFLLSLPWTGLAPLWATRHATSVLLGSAAVLVVLINAAFQNGEIAPNVARVIRISARGAALALVPIVAIAAHALGLRVGDYGWTTDRIIAASCLVIAGLYAIGYAWAACRRGGWLASVASANIVTAFAVLAVLLLLFSPVADPARLSVNDQMARFMAGRIKADKFDVDYLKFEGARYGLAALNDLKTRTRGTDAALIRERAELALKKENRWSPPQPKDERVNLSATVRVWPKTSTLPASFLSQDWRRHERTWELPLCLTQSSQVCDAYLIDFDGDGKSEVLLVGETHPVNAIMKEGEDGKWTIAGKLLGDLTGCAPLREKLQAGDMRTIAPRLKDLEIAGQRIEVQNSRVPSASVCPPKHP